VPLTGRAIGFIFRLGMKFHVLVDFSSSLVFVTEKYIGRTTISGFASRFVRILFGNAFLLAG
jgi:hypothetical protein